MMLRSFQSTNMGRWARQPVVVAYPSFSAAALPPSQPVLTQQDRLDHSLYRAAQQGQLQEVRNLLKQGAHHTCVKADGALLLKLACYYPRVLGVLLKAGLSFSGLAVDPTTMHRLLCRMIRLHYTADLQKAYDQYFAKAIPLLVTGLKAQGGVPYQTELNIMYAMLSDPGCVSASQSGHWDAVSGLRSVADVLIYFKETVPPSHYDAAFKQLCRQNTTADELLKILSWHRTPHFDWSFIFQVWSAQEVSYKLLLSQLLASVTRNADYRKVQIIAEHLLCQDVGDAWVDFSCELLKVMKIYPENSQLQLAADLLRKLVYAGVVDWHLPSLTAAGGQGPTLFEQFESLTQAERNKQAVSKFLTELKSAPVISVADQMDARYRVVYFLGHQVSKLGFSGQAYARILGVAQTLLLCHQRVHTKPLVQNAKPPALPRLPIELWWMVLTMLFRPRVRSGQQAWTRLPAQSMFNKVRQSCFSSPGVLAEGGVQVAGPGQGEGVGA